MNEIDNSTERSLRLKQIVESEPLKQGRLLVVAIGINKYVQWPTLKNAVQDAVGFQQVLIDKFGFTAPVEPLTDENATKTAINDLAEDRLRGILQEDDNLILFFAGHGHTRVDKLGGQNIETGFLIPVEASSSDKYSQYIEIDPFLKSVAKLPARHILVILDSCNSGFALGEVKQYRNAVSYTKDLSSKVSRRVITSALRDQPALDGGPIPEHSLFTGTLINGFNWGEADMDGNGLISSSELGLFIQQKVSQASESQQTPDFGAFHWDDPGEMVISLRNQSFDAIKARAFSAFGRGEVTTFKELVNQLIAIRPSSPETLYLEYKMNFLENNIERVIEVINELHSLNFNEGLIPLSKNDIWELHYNLPCWKPVLSIDENPIPVDIQIFHGKEENQLSSIGEQKLNELNGYRILSNALIQFKFKNLSEKPVHIYMAELDSEGRFFTVSLWDFNDPHLEQGLESAETYQSQAFTFRGSSIYQFRFFVSPKKINFFIYPHTSYGRAVSVSSVEKKDLEDLNVKFLNLFIIP